jgi:molecular chaperone IbpA
MADLMQAAMRGQGESHYPPYDIEKTGEDQYRITLAVAGFKVEELSLVAEPHQLVIAGTRQDTAERAYLHRGISGRNFERRFELADYVVVKSATYTDGLLAVELVREIPDALKPRQISITVGVDEARPEAIEAKRVRAAA